MSKLVDLVNNQKISVLDDFETVSGIKIKKVPVAYKTWGTLNSQGTNCMVICHALSGSADVEDCFSPVTVNPETGKLYGPEFPLMTIRDDVRAHKMILDSLGVNEVQYVIGGSMGGMQVLEWAFFGSKYAKHIIPIATAGRHSAWGISWGEVLQNVDNEQTP
ncbi:homoserine O- acetyltransferase [Dinochytrium kinnereticum]|nr:homoserine O- acetyltransferase [Dinochytrium kinnereticum]